MVHVFNVKDLYFALDTNTGLVHALDKIVYDLLSGEKFKDENKYKQLYGYLRGGCSQRSCIGNSILDR